MLVVLLGHLASLLVLVSLMSLRAEPWPRDAALLWALGAGVVAAFSLIGFYMALSRGAMGASAAISGVLAAAVPAAVSALIDGRPSVAKLTGFLLAFAAIVLIAYTGSSGTASGDARTGSTLAIASGLGFGLYFVALRFSSSAGELGPMTVTRCGSAATAAVLLACSARLGDRSRFHDLLLPRGAIVWLLAGATLDTSANLLFLLATRTGRLDVAAVLASLYPAPTILLAAVLLRERPTAQQWTGMALGAVAVILIAL